MNEQMQENVAEVREQAGQGVQRTREIDKIAEKLKERRQVVEYRNDQRIIAADAKKSLDAAQEAMAEVLAPEADVTYVARALYRHKHPALEFYLLAQHQRKEFEDLARVALIAARERDFEPPFQITMNPS